jgi:hypothetical protein
MISVIWAPVIEPHGRGGPGALPCQLPAGGDAPVACFPDRRAHPPGIRVPRSISDRTAAMTAGKEGKDFARLRPSKAAEPGSARLRYRPATGQLTAGDFCYADFQVLVSKYLTTSDTATDVARSGRIVLPRKQVTGGCCWPWSRLRCAAGDPCRLLQHSLKPPAMFTCHYCCQTGSTLPADASEAGRSWPRNQRARRQPTAPGGRPGE